MRSPIARAARTAALSILLPSALLACSGAPTEAPIPHHPLLPAKPPAPPPVAEPSIPVLPSHLIAQLDDESTSPYLARRGEESLLLFASKGRWNTRPLAADGSPKTKAALDVASVAEITMAALKPVAEGYAVIWVETIARNHAIKLLALDAEGRPLGEPTLITQLPDDVAWVDLLPNAKGALALWEVPHDDRSDVFVAPIAGAKLDGVPVLVAHDVAGWQAVATERGAALATVVTGAPASAEPASAAKGGKKKKGQDTLEDPQPRGSKLGQVHFAELDPRGKPSADVLVSSEPTAQVDVEIIELGGHYLTAWTDERNIDPCVYTASIEPGGKVSVSAHRATSPIGEQALVSLTAAPWAPGVAARSARALLGWEDLLRSPREGRQIHLGTIGPDGALGKERATLLFAASGPPDIVADGDGFAAVTLAPVPEALPDDEPTPPGAAPPRRREAPIWPSYVRFAPDLSVLASEPVRADPFVDHNGVPYLVRTLSCAGGACATLASAAGKGAPLALVSLPIRRTEVRPVASRDPDETPPRPSALSAIADGDHLSKVAAAELPGGGTLSAWVTYYLDGAINTGKKKGAKKDDDSAALATVGVRSIGPTGVPGKTVLISKRAISIGGVSLAAERAPGDKGAGAALAWVTRVRGEPQVFVTKLGPDGDKLAEKGVTVIARKKGKGPPSECSDAAIAVDGAGGWIVAWVDTRDGNAEIYAARLDKSLTKVVADKRITEAPGDSAEVQIVVRGDNAFLVWSDARGNPDDGSGDIYLARLDAKTLTKEAPETRLFASALHSRTPQIVPYGSGFLVSWIEDAFGAGKEVADAKGDRGLELTLLDAKGAPLGAPRLVKGEGKAAVTSAALACQTKGCRGVMTSAVGEALLLGVFELDPAGNAGPLKTVAALTGPVTQDVSPMFAGASGTSLFFADDAVGGSGRVRWMQIGWP